MKIKKCWVGSSTLVQSTRLILEPPHFHLHFFPRKFFKTRPQKLIEKQETNNLIIICLVQHSYLVLYCTPNLPQRDQERCRNVRCRHHHHSLKRHKITPARPCDNRTLIIAWRDQTIGRHQSSSIINLSWVYSLFIFCIVPPLFT